MLDLSKDQNLKKKRLLKVLWVKLVNITALLLALLILNFSVDPPDSNFTLIYQNNQVKEDISKNDIENLYEFITEMLLGMDNHVTEYDDSDQELQIKKIDLMILNDLLLHPEAFIHCIKKVYPLFCVNSAWEFVCNKYIPPDSTLEVN
jgi:hypothetical protein